MYILISTAYNLLLEFPRQLHRPHILMPRLPPIIRPAKQQHPRKNHDTPIHALRRRVARGREANQHEREHEEHQRGDVDQQSVAAEGEMAFQKRLVPDAEQGHGADGDHVGE